ncbi:helicase-related protein [Acetonema longum]|uniref:Putative DNA helicase n=1 Tax=Acetonema longum DSM 6540 TaxID=1009370 RepID=F7NKN1_9FIRM|nr:helicase-related protein [Acetonema longum]EGO63408.1 putative DNA helicase [Acetonema longum DSM 6540]
MTKAEIQQQTYAARNVLINEVRKELLGPGSEHSIPDESHEIITDLPEVRYSVGILFPQKEKYMADNDDSAKPSENNMDTDDEDNEDDICLSSEPVSQSRQEAVNIPDEESLDEEISLSSQNMPSSMGYTFFVRGNSSHIFANIQFGTYKKARLADCAVPFKLAADDSYELPVQFRSYAEIDRANKLLRLIQPLQKKYVYQSFNNYENLTEGAALKEPLITLCNQLGRNGFVRIPHDVNIDIDFTPADYVDQNHDLDGTSAKITALRKQIAPDVFSITIMMVNGASGSYNGMNSIFQPQIKVIASEESPYRFCEYTGLANENSQDEEELSLALLYRNKKVYGTGHGTSVNWNIDKNGLGYIVTDFFPQIEVPQMDFGIADSSVDQKCLSMKYLSDLDSAAMTEKIAAMKALINSYSAWIDKLSKMSKNEEEVAVAFQAKAKAHIVDCKDACDRMNMGLRLLEENQMISQSLQLANRAMFMQRIHLKLQEVDKYPGDIELQEHIKALNYYDESNSYFWRPFQLAFLLMSLQSIVDPNCKERDIVDLIWFPTGGGKTEAYLGLTAFTIFYRRLAFPDTSGGTTVIMRYTLRLLAAQQFVRAATLICACEAIRKDSLLKKKYPVYPLGSEAISIGLWIGGDHTPNKNGKAKEHFDKLWNAKDAFQLKYAKDQNNKFQILKCPWCGTKMVKDVRADKKVVGEWGYRLRNNKHFYLCCPQEDCDYKDKLPIQIVDEELYDSPPTLLFGTVDKFAMLPWKNDVGSFFATNSNNRTPELIIQDELHLISGPLGTMVGLYETAVDALCSAKGVKPKIIASTATIRRAKEQCSVLYNREVRQFPPSGLNADDSYFAREAKLSVEEQKYGRMYIGIMPSGKTKAMMEIRAIAAILQRVDMMQLPDEVKDKFWTLAIYFNSLRDLGKCRTMIDDDVKDFIKRTAYRFGVGRGRTIAEASELTSRISTSELNETLEKLERLEYSKENQDNRKWAIHTLLATNMISVGVDVARLNVMLIVGQPKLTSEYIQASSRIGRSYPGVAITLYDGTKSRDRSHYEQFKSYHESFYRFVEPTGATPFSKPARDRALHAVIVSMVRHLYGLSSDPDAATFDPEYLQSDLAEMRTYILKRVNEINSRTWNDLEDDTAEIETRINEIVTAWYDRVKIAGGENFYYGDRFMMKAPAAGQKRLLKVFGTSAGDPAYETMTSMRNVDQSIAANILVWEDEL